MSKTSSRKENQQARLDEQRRGSRIFMFSVLGVIAVVAAAIAVGSGGRDGGTRDTAAGNVERSGHASALGVEVDAKTVALGHVPLNTTVEPSWKLVNNSGSEVSFGEPHAEVVEGCCPGPLRLGTQTLAPSEITELSFPLQMHAGMDGAHEFDIHVPLTSGGQQAILELSTTGHFSS